MWLKESSTRFKLLVPLLLLFAVQARTASADGELTDAEFKQLHQKLTKMSTQRVWSIPWQLSIRKARELAAKENKPVFLWISSNGGTHPLGPC